MITSLSQRMIPKVIISDNGLAYQHGLNPELEDILLASSFRYYITCDNIHFCYIGPPLIKESILSYREHERSEK